MEESEKAVEGTKRPLRELKALFREIDERNKTKRRPTEDEVLALVQSYRHEKRKH